MTDLQQFEKTYAAVTRPLDTAREEELLKQAYMLYKGPIFGEAARSREP